MDCGTARWRRWRWASTIGAYAGKFDAERLLQALQDHRFTNISAAATHYRMMRELGRGVDAIATSSQKLSFTGEPIDSETAAFCRGDVRPAAVQHVRHDRGRRDPGELSGRRGFRRSKPGSLGKPMPGGKVEVQRPDGMPCPPGVIGEIKVWRRDGWIPTKDLGRIDEDGYFFHGGRADDVIISAGWTMSAIEIEDAILKHPDVREAAAIGVPDTLRGQVVKAFVVDRPARATRPSPRRSRTSCAARLSQHEYPRHVAFVAELPKTPAGKVNRKSAARARGTGSSMPSSETACKRSAAPTLPEDHRGGPRRAAPAHRREDRRDRRAVVPRGDARQHPPLRARHRRRQSAVVRSRTTRRRRATAASSRCRASCSPPAGSSRAMSAACPASTRCGRAPTGPGTSRSGATTTISTEAWLKDLIEHETRFAGRAVQQIYHVDFFNQHGDLVADADSWCFRTERDHAREQGTKYKERARRGRRAATPTRSWPRSTSSTRARRSAARRRATGRTSTVGEALPTMVKGPMTVTGFIAYAQGWGGLYIRANKLAWKLVRRASGPRHQEPLRHPRLSRARALGGGVRRSRSARPAPTTTAPSAARG